MRVIKNCHLVCENKIVSDSALVIQGQHIADIIPIENITSLPETFEVIDAKGGYVTPGFIDIHSDYIENLTAPRPTPLMDIKLGIREAERILSSQGITTMFHSLSIYNEDILEYKPIRRPENVSRLIDEINQTRNEQRLIRHRLHARFEVESVTQVSSLLNYLKNDSIHLLSFMDHTPGQGQYRDIQGYVDTIKGYQKLSTDEVHVKIKEKQATAHIALEDMKELINKAHEKGVGIASHDDDQIDKVDFNQQLGMQICEFPITLEVAKYAYQKGMYTAVGAPNVLLGGSHSGNLSALEAIQEGCASILCSDYYPASLLYSVFKLHRVEGYPLPQVMKLITINPAKAVNMDDEIGSIEVGKKADLNIIQFNEDYPVITECIVDGKIISQYHYRMEGVQ